LSDLLAGLTPRDDLGSDDEPLYDDTDETEDSEVIHDV